MLSKIVILGIVERTPEQRFTQSNVAITGTLLGIGSGSISTVAIGKLAEKFASEVEKGQNIIISGRLQTAKVKTNTGAEKTIAQIEISEYDLIAVHSTTAQDNEELIGEDEIPF